MIAAACTCGTRAGTGRPTLRRERVCWIFCRLISCSPRTGSPSGRRSSAEPLRCWIAGRRIAQAFAQDYAAVRSPASRWRESRQRPSGVVRTAGLIRSNHDDAHIVMLQISGTTRVQQGERSPNHVPGRARRRAGGQTLRARLPGSVLAIRDQVAPWHPASWQRSSARRRHGSSDPLRAICSIRTSSLTQPATKLRFGPCRNCCAGVPRNSGLSPYSRTLQQAVAIIREKMFEPLLGRDRVAQELGVSVRTLARAFAMHGTTFDRSLWNCRLEAAYEALLSSRVAPASPKSPCVTAFPIRRTLRAGSKPDLASHRDLFSIVRSGFQFNWRHQLPDVRPAGGETSGAVVDRVGISASWSAPNRRRRPGAARHWRETLPNVTGAEIRQFRRPGVLLRRAWVDALTFEAEPRKAAADGLSRHGDRLADYQTCANIAVNGRRVKDTAELHDRVAAVR